MQSWGGEAIVVKSILYVEEGISPNVDLEDCV